MTHGALTHMTWIVIALAVAVAMDFWAALLHRRAWHKWLWGWHASHHTARRGRFEKNDVLSGLHAPIAALAIVWGSELSGGPLHVVAFGIGMGMTAFGAAYLIVHDGLAHGRLPVRFLLRFRYLRRVVGAHRAHHARDDGPPYGLFFGPGELRRHAKRRR